MFFTNICFTFLLMFGFEQNKSKDKNTVAIATFLAALPPSCPQQYRCEVCGEKASYFEYVESHFTATMKLWLRLALFTKVANHWLAGLYCSPGLYLGGWVWDQSYLLMDTVAHRDHSSWTLWLMNTTAHKNRGSWTLQLMDTTTN